MSSIKNKIIAGAAGIVGLALAAAVVLAAPGDPVPPGSITPPGPGGSGCGGIGVAYDGATIWYTCADESKIRKTDLTGADLGFIDTAEGVTLVSVDAIAWDPNEGKIWGGELVDADGVGGNDTCRIYSIDPVTGAATKRFDRTDTGCTFNYFDGLTVDSVTDTLYYSPDVQKFINHLKKDGTAAVNDPIDFETLTSGPDKCPGTEPFPDTDPVAGCNNSGLAIGIDGSLFAGTDGEGKIILVDPVAKAFLSEFTSVSGRDEDLECGPEISGKETILSRDFFFPGRIDILEVPEGTCVSPVVPPEIKLDPPTDSNPSGSDHTVTATMTQGGQPLPGVLVSFSVVSGPNIGQVSDPGECSVDPNCNTDAAGQTSWTYTSNGTVGTDVIEACFTDDAGEKHCAQVEKDWESLPGRMTGGGTIPAGNPTLEGKHGFELHCDAADLPNRLEVNWGKGNKFHLETLTSAVCENNPALDEEQPVAGFDTYKGTGTGRLNGVSGASAKWVFTDDGEPGTDDHALISITDGVGTYTFSGLLKNGNQQAHPAD